jgi:hypothetical protein
MLYWPDKDLDEVLDYVHDWTPRLASTEDGDTVVSVLTVVDSGSVLLDSPAGLAGMFQTTWLSGGTACETCIITLRATTALGRVYDETVQLKISGV